MNINLIIESEPNKDSLVYNAFETIDYRDAHSISFEKNTFGNILEFTSQVQHFC